MKWRWLGLAAIGPLSVIGTSGLLPLSPAKGAAEVATRVQKVSAGQVAIIARHSQWDRNCKSLESPIVKIEKPPLHGRIGTEQAQYKPTGTIPGGRNTNCLGKEMTGTSLSYSTDAGFTGRDEVLYTVVFTKRRSGLPKEFSYRVILDIAPSSTGKPTTTVVETKPTEHNGQPATTVTANSAPQDSQLKKLSETQQKLETSQQHLTQQQAATANELEKVKTLFGGIILPATEDPKAWMLRVAAVPVQQQQFCRIVDQFYGDLANVYQLHNDIKKNALFRDRQQDMATLLPRGEFENWVVQIKEVTQAPDGSAAVMLQPPCRAMLGSDACQKEGSKIRATVATSSPLYRELARVSAGDFVVVSGKILYAESETPNQPLPTYAVYQAGSHCSTLDGSKQEDVFVTEIGYLVQLR